MLEVMNLKNLVLRPNCLLTKSQLAFVPGPRSLLFYKKPFGLLPEFLFEHGYQNVVLALPFQAKKTRRLAFRSWLDRNTTKNFHLILDDLTYFEFADLTQEPQFLSCTVISASDAVSNVEAKNLTYFTIPDQLSQRLMTPLSYRLHQVLCWIRSQPVPNFSQTFSKSSRQTLDRFLDHCIKLAENEFHA